MNLRSDIEQLTLADVIQGDIKNGYSPNSTESETGYWVLGLGALTDAGLNSAEIKPVEFNDKVQSALLEPGDFLISRSNTPDKVGRSLRFKGEIKNCSYPDLMMRFRPNTQLIDPSFLEYQLQSAGVRAYLKSCAAGSSASMVKITKSTVANTPIQLPPRAEQTKIAQVLSTWDKAIATTERLLANSQQQKQALAQNLLTGRKRHSEFSGTWKSYRFGDLFERITQKNTEGNTNVVTISAQYGLIRQDEFFKKTVASATLEGYYLLSQGQFAYNKSYSNGYPMGAIKRLNRYEKGVVTTLYICFAVRDKANCCPVFFEQFFDAGLLNEGLAQIAHEGGRAHGLLNVKPADFFSLKVQVPSLEEQQKIAKVLSTADAEIANLQAQLDKLKLEKKALMQQLLTGKRRVRLDDEEEDVAPIRRVG